ncbi:MAG: hypothetical protein ACHP84_10200 [Caulobacterales bacterium]
MKIAAKGMIGFLATMSPSPSLASIIYNWANVGLIAGLVIGVVSTVFIVWMGNIRDADLRQRLAEANAAAEGAKKDAAASNAAASRAQADAAASNLARLKLEVRIAPRRLTGSQRAAFEGALHPTSGMPLIVASRVVDAESGDFADDLAGALKEGHWPNVSRSMNWITTEHRGVFVATVEGTSTPEVGDLIAALKRAGITAEPMTISGDDLQTISPWFVPGTLYLLVGVKP